MSDAQHFRDRAIDCRALAKSARNEVDAAMLEEIADEMEAEAQLIESRKAAQTRELSELPQQRLLTL